MHLEHLFNLKFAVKELERNSKRCEKEEKQEKAKTKQAIQKGNMEVARIHAENAIRQKNQAINYLRMSARVDAVASRVQTALTTRKVTHSMAGTLMLPPIVYLLSSIYLRSGKSNGCGYEKYEFRENIWFNG